MAALVLFGRIDGGYLFTFAVLLLSRNYCSRYLGVGQYCIIAIYGIANVPMDKEIDCVSISAHGLLIDNRNGRWR